MWLWTLGTGGNGDAVSTHDDAESDEGHDEDEESSEGGKAANVGFTLDVRRGAQDRPGLGVHLDQSGRSSRSRATRPACDRWLSERGICSEGRSRASSHATAKEACSEDAVRVN